MPIVTPPDLVLRRAVLAGALCALAAPVLARTVLFPTRLAFAALRNGKKIGEQSMTFETGDGLTVRTVAEMAVKLGPISLYRYRHEATERWRGDAFVSLQTRTNDNGRMLQVSARREAGAVRIVQPSGAEVAGPESALPFTHWNRRIADAALFNPQDGLLLKERGAPMGRGTVTRADGSVHSAEGVAFSGEVQIEDWYDQDGVWAGLEGRLKDGSTLLYRRL